MNNGIKCYSSQGHWHHQQSGSREDKLRELRSQRSFLLRERHRLPLEVTNLVAKLGHLKCSLELLQWQKQQLLGQGPKLALGIVISAFAGVHQTLAERNFHDQRRQIEQEERRLTFLSSETYAQYLAAEANIQRIDNEITLIDNQLQTM